MVTVIERLTNSILRGTKMITRLLVFSILGSLSCAVFASDIVDDGAYTVNDANLIVADNKRKERRDDRG